MFEDTKGILRGRKFEEGQTIQWPKDRQYNGQKKKDKGTNNNLQNTTQKTKDLAKRTLLNIKGELRCS